MVSATESDAARLRRPQAIVGVVGCGVTGFRVVAHLLRAGIRVAVHDPAATASGDGSRVVVPRGAVAVDVVDDLLVADMVVLCTPSPHAPMVSRCIRAGVPVVSIGDDLADVRAMLDLDRAAVAGGVRAVVGAGMAPGLSGLLAAYLSTQLDMVDELHIAVHGTAGPACARQHHDALGSRSIGWHDGQWVELPGGSGRELVWFPEPIAAHDCYRAAIADPVLLRRSFPSVERLSARVSATRRDRLTARLPMLMPPHASGDLGAVRAEARGARADGARHDVIAGAAGATADLAAAVCAAVTMALLDAGDSLAPGVHSPSDDSMRPLDLLARTVALGVRLQEFTGVARSTSW